MWSLHNWLRASFRDNTPMDRFAEELITAVGSPHPTRRALSDESGVAKWLEKNGPGMHHVAYATDDIEGALGKIREAGLRLIDEEPRVGIRGSRVAFLHPKSTGGVLTELVEPVH